MAILKNISSLMTILLLSLNLISQENSWIRYDQQYFKIQVVEDGIYRISRNNLTSANVPVNVINANHFQIFHNGEEQYIHVSGISNDGTLGNSGYIEFYGQRNKASHEYDFYDDPESMVNPDVSLYNDTAAYFLTWNFQNNNRRMAIVNDSEYSQYMSTQQNYCIKHERVNYTGQYRLGCSRSLITESEGWFDASLVSTTAVTKTISTTQPYAGGRDTEIELAVASVTNSSSAVSSARHHLIVDFLNETRIDTLYNGYNFVRKKITVPSSLLTNSISFRFLMNFDSSDKGAVSYIDVKYPHNWDFSGSSYFEFYLPQNDAAEKDYFEIRNFAESNEIILYDISNHERITVNTSEGIIKGLVGHTNSERFLILTNNNSILEVANIVQISPNNKFTNYIANTPNADFVIITHKDYATACNQFATYKNSRGYTSLVADINQLYDQYAYGINKNPSAIRNFCKNIYNSSPSEKYLFLVGRALYNSSYNVKNNRDNYAYSKVPSAGDPASDVILTKGLFGTDKEPLFATGRLAVTSQDEVYTYLNKLQQYENTSPDLWMKEILHFGGGADEDEQSSIESYLRNYQTIIEDSLFGGNVHLFLKNTSIAITSSHTDSTNNLINNGVSLMTFFGHGASTTFDHNIESPEFYTNEGKYPFIIGNSCYAGAIHSKNSETVSDAWIKSTKGAIGFLSSMNIGSVFYLNIYSTELYKNITYKNYNKPIGIQVKNTIKNILQEYTNSINTEIAAYEVTLHGDPSVIINSNSKPDLKISAASITIMPQEISTVLDSFSVKINIKNIGKAITDNFYVYLERTLPTGEETHYETIVDGCFYQKDATIKIPTDKIKGTGLNSIRIYVDGMNEISEISETNNFVSTNFIIKSNDIFPIYPYEYAIYPRDTVNLIASTGDPFIGNNSYKFQIDTTSHFNSPFLRESSITSEGGIISWKVPFQLNENTVYYWRVGTDNPIPDSILWKESSFIYIEGKEGWSQAHRHQFKKDIFRFIEYKDNHADYTYIQGQRQLNCHNKAAIATGSFEEVSWNIDNILNSQMGAYGGCSTGAAMVAVVIDPQTLVAWQSDKQNYGHRNYPWCFSALRPQSYFTFDISTSKLDSLSNFLNEVPNDYYILIYSWRHVAFSAFPESFLQTMNSIGATRIRTIPDNVPYIFCTRKGDPSIYREVFGTTTADEIDMDPVTLVANLDYGYIESVKVGPSKRWKSLSWLQENDNEEITKLQVIGITPHGNEFIVIDSIGTDNYVISDLENSIDFNTYPNVKLQLFTKDTTNRTPSQLKKWQLTFDGVPETAISPNLGYEFKSDTIERGNDIVFVISTKNVSNYDMDSLVVKYWIKDSENNETVLDIRKLRTHPANDIITDTIKYSTIEMSGLNSIWVEFNPINENTWNYYQAEQYHHNNIATKYFYVSQDNTNPLLEVSFDGKFIMNGEIVSAKPEILISLKDENKYLALNDTSLFSIKLTNLESGVTKQVNFGIQENPKETIEWIPAELPNNSCKIIYKPIFAEDGKYQLQVSAKDATGNNSGDNNYIIDFEIITKSTITNLVNYPNPFSSKTRFVFELTGSEIPNELEIEIFTITGKIVKRIYLEDLGPITIGKNITEYSWDGCDFYGDKLANGLYFYTVKAKINGESIEKRDNGTNSYFKKEIGKMYIMR